MRIGIGVENVADRDVADGQRDAVDVTFAGNLVDAALDGFLLAAETEGRRKKYRCGRNCGTGARLLRLAIGEAGEPEGAGKAESLSELGVEIDFPALPQPQPDEGGRGPGLPPWLVPGRLLAPT